jgi:uncharacterized protein DUF4252
MKITSPVLAMFVFLLAAPLAAQAPGPLLQLGHLDRLAALAAETVNVTIDPSMMKLAAALLKGDGDQAALKDMLNGIKGIYVRSFEFERENVYTAEDLNAIRKQLSNPKWERQVTVDSKRDRELVEVYSWREGKGSGGFAILVAEPKELTVVNIVGPFDPAKIAALQGNFGIPRFPVDASRQAR